ncbi:M56 family metallopeptidase [Candidatus Nephthysia bennettiae]|uniref:M56 family metallopeptidase n=1 Tax=Candidatus Nephthysia bennettiae TaxID=3127016 RepID=A0A934K0P1_9BACT|nr:M56 family metallopeptidase [Candidatus Dormibacteraeota bacterium]
MPTERRSFLILAGLSAAALTCFGWLLGCTPGGACLKAATSVDGVTSTGSRGAILLLALSLVIWLVRLIWLLARAAAATRRLPQLSARPAALAAAMARTGVGRVSCLAAEAPAAFCVGTLQPRILVSEGLVRYLQGEELDAVLIHEHAHARSREPLLRAGYQAAAEVFFYIPLVNWWVRRQIEDSELGADRAALQRLGPRPVAGALWRLSRGMTLQGAAAFADVAQLRVTQVLGDPLPPRTPAFSIVGTSLMGLVLAFEIGFCLVEAVQHLI